MREMMAAIEDPRNILFKRFLCAAGTFGVGALASPLMHDLIYQALMSEFACESPADHLHARSAMAKFFWLAGKTVRCMTQEVVTNFLMLLLISAVVIAVDQAYVKPSANTLRPSS